MNTPALPCIVCGQTLFNVYEGVTNQPNNGVACQTSGNYGSTVWDSVNFDQLEFNVCDPCLVRAGEQGRVHIGRTRRPVYVVGYGRAGSESVDYTPVEWRQGMDTSYGENEELVLDEDDLNNRKLRNIMFFTPREEILEYLRRQDVYLMPIPKEEE